MGLFDSKSSKSKDSIKDIEYNVYKQTGIQGGDRSSDMSNKGCMMVIVVVFALLLTVVAIMSSFLGSGTGSLTCAETGCGNKAKAGSNYCWMHSASEPGIKRRNSTDNSSSSSDSKEDDSTDDDSESGSDDLSSNSSSYDSGNGSLIY